MEKNYYAVEVKCGHVGKGKYVPIVFAIAADSGKEAAQIGRCMPRAKHHNKECILSVNKINFEEFNNLLESNKNNKYLQCKNVQEQKEICPEIYNLVEYLDDTKKDDFYSEKRQERIKYKKKKESYKFNYEDFSNYDYEINYAC